MEDKVIEKLEKSIIIAMKNKDFNTAFELDNRIKDLKNNKNKNSNKENKGV